MELPNVIADPNYVPGRQRAAIVIPVYKTDFNEHELLSLKSTFHHLGHRDDIYWIAPRGFDYSKLDAVYGKRRTEEFPHQFFRSVADYSRLLLSFEFYERFQPRYSHILIVQTDATVLRDELDHWVQQPYHYIGAPWPQGWSYPLNGILNNGDELRCTALVGNGGFSLREIDATVNLLLEFPVALEEWKKNGFPEDFFIGLAASISVFYRLPNIRIASQFSVELEPDFFNFLNEQKPFGLHAWHLYAPDYWKKIIKNSMGVPFELGE